MKPIFISFILTGFAFFSFSQNSEIERAERKLSYRGEVFISFEIPAGKNPLAMVGNLSVDKIVGNTVLAFANQEQFNQFLSNGIDFRIVEEYYAPRITTMATTVAEMANWDRYPTYGVYVEMMNKFAQDFPQFCRIYNIGPTASGLRHLYFAKISSDVNSHKKKPQVMLTSTMHGDETTGFVLLLRLIDYLLRNYGIDDRVTFLLDNLEIWICPNENPDGTYRNNNAIIQNPTRSNINGIDLNRNYPCPRPNPPTPIQTPMQAETRAMINFTDTMAFVMSANIHGGIELVNFPWDAWKSSVRKHADHDWFYFVSREYADTARFFSPPTYMNPSTWQCGSCINGVTHGADWYYVFGSRQDFFTYFRRSREVTLELSNTKFLPSAQLPAHWDYNFRSLLNYLKQATFGIHGTVRDVNTLEPIEARIEMVGHDVDNSDVFSFLPLGNFHRPILAGTYTLRVNAPGYPEKVIHNVSTQNHKRVKLDIRLELPRLITEVEHGMILRVSPNPINSASNIEIQMRQPGKVVVEVFNLNGKSVAKLFSGFLQQGKTTINFGRSGLSLAKGIYILKAIYPGGIISERLLVL